MARPPSNLYRLGKLARRNKLAFGAIAAVTTVLVLGVAVSTWQAVRATRAEREQTRLRQRAEQAGEVAKQQEQLARKSADEARQQQRLASEQQLLARRRYYAAQMNLAMQAWDAQDPARTLDLLETQRPQSDERDLRSFEWRHLWALCNARLQLTLRGHARAVTCVAFSPTAGMLASSSEDETIRLWDIATGDERLVLKPESRNGVHAVVFSPDGSTLASRNYDGSVRLWHLPTGRLGLTLRGPYGYSRALAISPDGKLLASGGVKSVKLWDLATGNERMDLSIGGQSAMTTDFSPDGTMLWSWSSWGAKDGLWVWDLTGKPVAVKANLPGGGTVAWNFDCRTLATPTYQDIQVRDSDAGTLRATLKGHSAKIEFLAYSPDGKTLASCGEDRTVRLWHLNCTDPQNVPSEIVGVHLDTASCLAFSSDGGLLASADVDGSIKLWNLTEPLKVLEGRIAGSFRCGTNRYYSDLQSLLPLPDGTNFLAVTRDGTEERDIRLGHKRVLSPEAAGRGVLSRGGELLATSFSDGAVKLWTVSSGRLLGTISAHKADSPALAFAPDGRTLVTGEFSDNVVKLWDVAAAPKLLWKLQTSSAGIDAVGFSPDGKRIAASLRHQRFWLIDPATGRLERIVQTGGGQVPATAIVFSPDGKLLATAGESGRVRLWDVQTGALHAALKGHTTAVRAIAFSSDGATVASGSDDQTARLWDAATGQERVTFRKFRHTVTALAFTSDDQILLVGEHNGRVWMFRGDHHPEADARSIALK